MGLRAVHTALCALEATTLPAATIRLGDRGDGTAHGKEAARLRTSHINETHVPDLYRLDAVPWCWEYKTVSCLIPSSPNLGSGTSKTGGGASTGDGHLIPFGGTEERLRRTVCGVTERGLPTDYRADGGQRRDGLGGWIKARDGDYVDALRKGYGLTLLVTETTGAITPTFDALYRRYNKLSREPGTADYTVYGESRSSPQDFYRHHLAAHSAAVVFADVCSILNEASSVGFRATA